MLKNMKNKEIGINQLSGNLTTNAYMPEHLKAKLTEEDLALKDKLSFKEIQFPALNNRADNLKGLNILAGLQKINKKGHLTLYRALRFPTFKRMHAMIYDLGCCTPNYEQERILKLYTDKKYQSKRDKIRQDNLFQTIPQERVVQGLPMFHLANDALQIHRAFRGEKDRVVISAIHIPYALLKNGKIKIIANTAIDLDYANNEKDHEIKDFVMNKGACQIDTGALVERGIDLHESYAKNFPWGLKECDKVGIKQDFFLLDIYKIKDKNKISKLFDDTATLKANKAFLHGFFGDQNVFGRGSTRYLPSRCYRIQKVPKKAG